MPSKNNTPPKPSPSTPKRRYFLLVEVIIALALVAACIPFVFRALYSDITYVKHHRKQEHLAMQADQCFAEVKILFDKGDITFAAIASGEGYHGTFSSLKYDIDLYHNKKGKKALLTTPRRDIAVAHIIVSEKSSSFSQEYFLFLEQTGGKT
jgi:hypothetical protein